MGLLRADQIVLKDGDRVTGKIVKKDGEKLTIESRHFGVVTLKWAEVESVSTDQQVNVVLPNAETVKATLQPAGNAVRVATPATTQTVPLTDIVTLRNDAEQRTYERFLHPGIFDLWTVNGSINIAGTKGNAETSTVTTPLLFARTSSSSRTTAYLTTIRSTATIDGLEGQTAKAIRGGWSYSRNIAKKVSLKSFNDNEYDKFQALDLRLVLGGGVGYEFWKGERGYFALMAGGAWNHEKFGPATQPEFTRNSGETYWGDDFSYKLNSRTSVVQSLRVFHNLSNTGEYRANLDLGSVTYLTKWLTWNATISDRYLSNPVPGRRTNDFLYTTGLGFTYSR